MSNRALPSFTDRVMTAVDANYKEWGNSPSPKNWQALAAIANTIERMAAGTAEDKTYLSWAPPGTGKTETIIASIVQLTRDPRYADCGVIVFLSQLDQVRRLADSLLDNGLTQDDISLLVGNKSENDALRALGRGHFNKKDEWISEHQKARVVIATQAKLLSVVAFRKSLHIGSSMDDIWLYDGKTRRVRIWDETILPAKTHVIHEPKICEAIKLLQRAGFNTQADILESWRASLVAGEPTEVPAFDKELDLHAVLSLRKGGGLDEGSPLLTLLELQWQGLAVRKDYDGNAVLHYEDVLPEAFTPLLVTDASGNVRCLMREWDKGRSPVVPLESGEKRYDGLTIHHWNHAAGKSEYRSNEKRLQLAKAAASVFSRIPEGDEVLFIVRKPEKPYQNIERWEPEKAKTGVKGEETQGIRDMLTPEQNARAHFLTWGLHTATNRFSHIKHVVVVGLLQTATSVTAATMKAAGRMAVDEALDEKLIRNAHVREAAHNLLQGANRGASRGLRGSQCPEGCTLWVIFSTAGTMGLPSKWLFNECFPGASIENWEPFGFQIRSSTLMTDNRTIFADYLVNLLGNAPSITFTRSDLTDFDDTMTFNYLKKKPEPVRKLMAERGLKLELGERIKRGKVWVDTFMLSRPSSPVAE